MFMVYICLHRLILVTVLCIIAAITSLLLYVSHRGECSEMQASNSIHVVSDNSEPGCPVVGGPSP